MSERDGHSDRTERTSNSELARLIGLVPDLTLGSNNWLAQQGFETERGLMGLTRPWLAIEKKMIGAWPLGEKFHRAGFRVYMEKKAPGGEAKYVYMALLATLGGAGQPGNNFAFSETSSDLLPITDSDLGRLKYVSPTPTWRTVEPILRDTKPFLHAMIRRITPDTTANDPERMRIRERTLNTIAGTIVAAGINIQRRQIRRG